MNDEIPSWKIRKGIAENKAKNKLNASFNEAGFLQLGLPQYVFELSTCDNFYK